MPPEPYKTTQVWDEVTLPDAIRQAHSTKAGTWGLCRVLAGEVRLVFHDPARTLLVTPDQPGPIPPQEEHHVEVTGPMRMQVEFYREPPLYPPRTKGITMTGTTTYKILLFMKRKPGMSMADFIDYYENRHAVLAMKHDGGKTTRYLRRYIQPQPHAESGSNDELPYDVISELWFEDRAAFDQTVAWLGTAVMPRDIVEDELNLFDRPTMRMATVIERETDLAAWRAKPGLQ